METTRPVWYGFVGFVTGVGALGLLMWTFPGGVLAPITRDTAASVRSTQSAVVGGRASGCERFCCPPSYLPASSWV